MEHDIHDFIKKAQKDLQAEYLRIQKRAAEDPGTAGDQGEENWASLLREWLPHYFHVVTKGRILTDSGYASPQIDVLVLYPSYPRILLDKKLYLSGGVAAAFECKTTLTAAYVKAAVETSAALKRSLPKREGTPYKELHTGIVYGLLAHSHSWKSQNSKPLDNVENSLWEADAAHVIHPKECIDFVTVSDLATWNVSKMTYLSPMLPFFNDEISKIYGPNGCATIGYIRHAVGADRQEEYFSPIGTLLSGLFSKLAWTFPDMRPLEEYFRKVNMSGSGEGRMRQWSIDIYSDTIKDRVYRGALSNGIPYDEWHIHF
ncbi:DUF6602 domain-containing protein [Geobacter grbiciae]|uniref:DUF6602 domain-containing protein n=1 Tax=Geobacter grbiciae TaxID=155042 RepID=UPI001C012AC5|nr:DUF6602 domain-containing protein [Geobacter grbiciae]MBT1073785.1 hypothetical protein [Geobacter grbiciae]